MKVKGGTHGLQSGKSPPNKNQNSFKNGKPNVKKNEVAKKPNVKKNTGQNELKTPFINNKDGNHPIGMPGLSTNASASKIQKPNVNKKPDVIIFNRVPKTGTRVFHELIWRLARDHHFNFTVSQTYVRFKVTKEELMQQIAELQIKKRPFLFDRHIYFFKLPKSSNSKETVKYINIVRDPIDRCASWYYFIRFEQPREMPSERRNRTFDSCLEQGLEECTNPYIAPYRCLQIPFFCGHDEVCVTKSREALEKAKQNVDKEYAVVGLTEDTRSFFQVIQQKIPSFFGGVVDMYDEYGKESRQRLSNPKHKLLSLQSTIRMEDIMALEIEFYKYVRNLFYRRHKHLLTSKE